MLDLLFFAAPGSIFPAAVAGVIGLVLGSFLNVVIYRVPRKKQRESDEYLAAESESRKKRCGWGRRSPRFRIKAIRHCRTPTTIT